MTRIAIRFELSLLQPSVSYFTDAVPRSGYIEVSWAAVSCRSDSS